MSGIFIDQNDKFDVTVYYEVVDKKIKVIENKKDGCQSITVNCQFPDFATTQRIMQSSMVKTDNGQSLDMLKFRSNMLYFLSVGWDVKKENGESLPFSSNELNKLHPLIASAIIDKIQEKMADAGSLSL